MSTLMLTHPVCLEHATPPGHPERVSRLETLLAALEDSEFEDLLRQEAPEATNEALLLAHPQEYIDALDAAVPESRWISFDSDTFMSPQSMNAARRAAGAATLAVDRVIAGEASNAFCAVRPPGHHAERAKAMGFCFLNNIVIGALHALERHGVTRVAIVDFDVHHGNGTEDLVSDDPRIMFVSTHQFPLYPGTGPDGVAGRGNVVNVALEPGMDGATYREIFNHRVLPAVDLFEPHMIFVSAGFDAHRDDPLAQINLDDEDFVWVTDLLLDLAEEHSLGRLVSSLEGGYNLEVLARAGSLHIKSLMKRG